VIAFERRRKIFAINSSTKENNRIKNIYISYFLLTRFFISRIKKGKEDENK